MNTDEREERLKQIRERQEERRHQCGLVVRDTDIPLPASIADIDFLLSLLDSQAKERDDWKGFAEECKEGIRASHRLLDELGVPREDVWLQETDGQNYGIEEVVEYPVYERIKMLPPFAATRMRDACVEKVRELQRDWDKAQSYDFRDATFYIVAALESLTLDQVEEKQ